MMRSRLVCIKHITYAVLSLILLGCGLEIGLRVYDSYTGELSTSPDDSPLSTRCWWSHHRLKPLLDVTEIQPDSGAEIHLLTNSYGLRGSEISVPKPPGVWRVVCLGDETTLAPDVEQGETFCTQLQTLLQSQSRLKVEVINAGIPGYCPLLSYLQAKQSLLALEPDLFIFNFDMSDIADDHQYRRFVRTQAGLPLACPHPTLDARSKQADETGRLRLLTPGWCKRHVGLLLNSGENSEDRRDIDTPQGRYAWLRDNPPDWSIYVEQALSPIGLLNELAKQSRSALLLAVVPAPWQIAAGACSGREARDAAGVPVNAIYKSRAPFEILGQYALEKQIPFCDASLVFLRIEHPERLYLHNAPRLSVDGHTWYARVLSRAIVNGGAAPWSNPSPNVSPGGPIREAAHETGARRPVQ